MVIIFVFEIVKVYGVMIVLNFVLVKVLFNELLLLIDIIVLNEIEVELLFGIKVINE